jgi:hypothetical protein
MLVILATLPFAAAAEELFEGDVYLHGTNKGLLLFKHRNEIEKKGDTLTMRHIYTTVSGGLAALEEVQYENGRLSGYRVEMPDSKCGCKLERRNDKIVFSFTRMADPGHKESDYSADIVTGPTLRGFISRNWAPLMQGKTVYFKLPAMNLQKVAEFQLRLQPDSEYAKNGSTVIRMKIANMFFRLFVDPVDLVFDPGTKRLMEIHGKSLLQRKVNGKTENPVVDIYYRYR